MNQYDGFEYVEVKFTANNGVSNEKVYSYRTRLDLRLGQRVFCPTFKSSRSEAVVVAVNCPDPGFRCKEITEIVPETEGGDA